MLQGCFGCLSRPWMSQDGLGTRTKPPPCRASLSQTQTSRGCWTWDSTNAWPDPVGRIHDRVQLRNRPLRTSWASAVPAAMQYLVVRLQQCRGFWAIEPVQGACRYEWCTPANSLQVTCPRGCPAGSCEAAQGRCGPPQGQSVRSTAQLCLDLRLHFMVKSAREKSSVWGESKRPKRTKDRTDLKLLKFAPLGFDPSTYE